MTEIKQIRTYTLSDEDKDCRTYFKTKEFLSNILFDEREGHLRYMSNSINLIGRTLILFKYRGKLIAKGIFTEKVEYGHLEDGLYSGYYQVEEDSVEIFNKRIDLDRINKYFEVKSLRRDQIFDLEYLDEINKMIEDYTG